MPSALRTRILVVDDSVVMRSLLRLVLGSDPHLELVGTASDGASALAILDRLRPDLAILDVEMPGMDGLATLRRIRARGLRLPIIMCSSLTRRGASVTLEALASGASDYVAKPSRQNDATAAIESLAQALLPKIYALTAKHAQPFASGGAAPARLPVGTPRAPRTGSSSPEVVVLGVSTGGPAALDVVLPALPATFPLPVLVVQHMPELFTQLLAERLDRHCGLHVCEAVEGEPVRPGAVHIARGGWHLELLASIQPGRPPTLHLTQAPPENHCRPAVDVLFRSAASVFGAKALAVVLTGMGSDGLAGARAVRARGGIVLAQDAATSTVWGMPGAVVRAGLAERILPLQSIASEILRLSSFSQSEAPELRESLVS